MAPSAFKVIHFQPIIIFTQLSTFPFFLKTFPHHCNLYLRTTFTMPCILNHYLNSTQDNLSLNSTPHILHLIIVISARGRCNASSFSLFQRCNPHSIMIMLCRTDMCVLTAVCDRHSGAALLYFTPHGAYHNHYAG